MPRMHIWVMDHRDEDWQQSGPIIAPWLIDNFTPPGKQYADYCALYNVWQDTEPPEIVGFFGYRKYLLLPSPDHAQGWLKPAHAPNWYQCSKSDFEEYRAFMAEWNGVELLQLLAQYDILQAAPFLIPMSVFKDFANSRSMTDASAMNNILPHWMSRKIYPYLFVTRWSVFDRMMREIEPLRLELEPLICAGDSTNEEYIKRPMAYVMERVYSHWLENSGLSIKEMPLLHCWEMS